MARQTRGRRKLAEERWPLLSNVIGCYFNQDSVAMHGSLSGAIAAACGDGPLEHRRAILKEWQGWNSTEGATNDIRPFLDDGFAIDLWFSEAIDARKFMNRIYDGLVVSTKIVPRPAG